MKILVINGNTKKGGFTEGALSIVAERLENNGVEVDRLRLIDADIRDCISCFTCLKTGECVLDDDMAGIIRRMVEADGFVVGSPVRNGHVTACYKRFYERITYTVGFPLRIEDKHTLAISSVGMMGGKAANRKFLGLQDVCRTRLSDYIHCKVGIPTKVAPSDMRERLEAAADRLVRNIETRRPKGWPGRIGAVLDRIVMNRFLFKKSPDLYANVIARWKEKGYIS